MGDFASYFKILNFNAMKRYVFILFYLICLIPGIGQKLTLLEYNASDLVTWPEAVNVSIKGDLKSGKTYLKFYNTSKVDGKEIITTRLEATLNARKMLVDSFLIFDEFGDKVISGFFKDSIQGVYENQNTPWNFYYLGGIKSGEFKTYTKAVDTANAGLFLESVTNYLNGEKSGKYVSYYKNSKQIQYEYHYSKNKMDGGYTHYNKDGTYLEVGNYYDGKKQGEWTYYYENNQPARKEVYDQNGQLHGQTKIWHRNGKLAQNNWYENNEKHGYFFSYHANGNKKDSLFFINGKMHGKNVKYFDNGQKSFECTYDNGKEISARKYWNENGKLSESIEFKDGKKDGTFRVWNQEGKLIVEKYFINDLPDGIHKTWHDNGKVASKIVYKNGKQAGNALYYDETGKLIKDEPPFDEEEIPSIEEIVEEMDQAEEFIGAWEDPTVYLFNALSPDGQKQFAKFIGYKYRMVITKNGEYSISVHPNETKVKKAAKAIELLQNSFVTRQLKINGKPYTTTVDFTFE